MLAQRWILPALALVFAPSFVHAQDESHWGVIASVTPRWRAPVQFEKTLKVDVYGRLFSGNVYLEASDFAIGVASGRAAGGDWGISFVRHTVEDDSVVEDVEHTCGFLNVESGCLRSGTSYVTRGVTINGVLLHKYVPFVTIKGRVQIGGVAGGGVGQFRGSVERHDLAPITHYSDRRTGVATGIQGDSVTTLPATRLGRYSVLPLGNLQLAAAVVVAPGLKIRGSWGLEFPGYTDVSITGVYLFDRN